MQLRVMQIRVFGKFEPKLFAFLAAQEHSVKFGSNHYQRDSEQKQRSSYIEYPKVSHKQDYISMFLLGQVPITVGYDMPPSHIVSLAFI